MSKPRIPITTEEIRATKNVRALQDMCLNLKKNYDEVTSNLRFINSLYIKAKADLEQKTTASDNLQTKCNAMDYFQRKALAFNQQISEIAIQNPQSNNSTEEKLQFYQKQMKNIIATLKSESAELEKIAIAPSSDHSQSPKAYGHANDVVAAKKTETESSLKLLLKRTQDESNKLKAELEVAAKKIARLVQENDNLKSKPTQSSTERKFNVLKEKAKKMSIEMEDLKKENDLLRKQLIILSRSNSSQKQDETPSHSSRRSNAGGPHYISPSGSTSRINRYTPKVPKNPSILGEQGNNSARSSSVSVRVPLSPDKELQKLSEEVARQIREANRLDNETSEIKQQISDKKKELAEAISRKEEAAERNRIAKAEFEQQKVQYDQEIKAVNQRREKIRSSTEKFEKQINEVSDEIKKLRLMNIDGKKSLEEVERSIKAGTEKINRRRSSLMLTVAAQKERLANREKDLQHVQKVLDDLKEIEKNNIIPEDLKVQDTDDKDEQKNKENSPKLSNSNPNNNETEPKLQIKSPSKSPQKIPVTEISDDDDFSDLKPMNNQSPKPILQLQQKSADQSPKLDKTKPKLEIKDQKQTNQTDKQRSLPGDDDDDFSDLKPANRSKQPILQINQNQKTDKPKTATTTDKPKPSPVNDDDDDDFSDLKPANQSKQLILQISPKKDKPKPAPKSGLNKLAEANDDDDDFSDLKPSRNSQKPTLQIPHNQPKKLQLPPPDDDELYNYDDLEPVKTSSQSSRRVSVLEEPDDDDEFADLKPIESVPPILSLVPEPKAEPKTLVVNLEHEVPKPHAKPGLAKYADDDNIENIMNDEPETEQLKIQPTTSAKKLPLLKLYIDADDDSSNEALRAPVGSIPVTSRRTMPIPISKLARKLPPPDSDEFDNFDNLQPANNTQKNVVKPKPAVVNDDDEFSDLQPMKSRPEPLQLGSNGSNIQTSQPSLIDLSEKDEIDDLFRSYEGDLVLKVSPKKNSTLPRQASTKKTEDSVFIADIIDKVPEDMRKGPNTPITFDDQHSFDYQKFVGDVQTHNSEMKHAKFGSPHGPVSNEEIASEFAGM